MKVLRNWKTWFGLFLVLIIVLGLQLATTTVAAASPIPIRTQAELEAISQNLSGHYLLMNDITISGDWEPIGPPNLSIGLDFNGFKGILDGNGYTIRNLNFNLTSSATRLGLFRINEGTIKNLGIEDASLSGDLVSSDIHIYAGFIAAINYGKIDNCYSAGSIDLSLSGEHATAYIGGIAGIQAMEGLTTNTYNRGNLKVSISGNKTRLRIGGIVGEITIDNGSRITNSYNAGRIIGAAGDAAVAGIAGNCYSFSAMDWNGGASIEHCYNTGAITAISRSVHTGERALASGITSRGSVSQSYNIGLIKATTHAGGIIAADGRVLDCYNAGSVLSSHIAAGIAGYSTQNTGATVTNCYNVGLVYGFVSEGIAYDRPGAMLVNNYYLETSTADISANSSALSGIQMQQQASFKGFDFERNWKMSTGSDYPLPTLRRLPLPHSDTTPDFAGGNGTIYSPFKVSTKQELNNVRDYPIASFILINNISFEVADFAPGGEFYNSGSGWIPICKGQTSRNEHIFAGIFDGQDYAISNLYVNDKELGIGGLFGSNFGVIKNLGVENGDITSSGSAGGIAGRNELRAQIINSYFTGKVSGTPAGGICGSNGAAIENCFSTATVYSNGTSGGIVGYSYAGTSTQGISNCYFSGNATGDVVGGIAGYLGIGGKIANTINVGTLKGSSDVGGIVGEVFGGSVSASYYNNNILKAVARLGPGTINAQYLSPEQLKQKASFPGFDFNEVWRLDAGMSHPVLKGLDSPVNHQPAGPEPVAEEPAIVTIIVGTPGFTMAGVTRDMVACYYQGRDTMMPIRMLEGFGVNFQWDESTKTATMSFKQKTVVLTIGSADAYINGVRTPIIGASGALVAPALVPGRTMIPLRFVSEHLGFKVTWDPSNTITISLP